MTKKIDWVMVDMALDLIKEFNLDHCDAEFDDDFFNRQREFVLENLSQAFNERHLERC